MIFASSDSHRNANPLKYLQEMTFPDPLELGEASPEITSAVLSKPNAD